MCHFWATLDTQLLGQQFPRTHLPLHAFRPLPLPSVLSELHGKTDFKKNLREFSLATDLRW